MAFNLNLTLKKKDEKSDSSNSALLEKLKTDPKVFIILMLVFCIALIALAVYAEKQTDVLITRIDEQKETYQNNQLAMANLKALQSKSEEYSDLKDKYDKLISNAPLDQMQIMMEMEKYCDEAHCVLTNISFSETPEGQGGSVREMPVALSVSGTFSDIMNLCNTLVTYDEFMRIDQIKMDNSGAAPGDEEKKTSAEITVVKFGA